MFFYGLLIFISFSYIIIYEIFIFPYAIKSVNQIIVTLFSINSIALKFNMILNDLTYGVIRNSSIVLEKEGDLFFFHFNSLMDFEQDYNQFINDADDYLFASLKYKTHSYQSDNFCKIYQNNINLKYSTNSTLEECLNSSMINGIEVYIIKTKNVLRQIYSEFRDGKGKNQSELIKILNTDDILFANIANGSYLRRYYDDLIDSLSVSFQLLCDYLNLLGMILLMSFILHYTSTVLYVFICLSKIICVHFEKLRIIISIVRKYKEKNNENIKLLDDYF